MNHAGFAFRADRLEWGSGPHGCVRALGVPTLLVNAAMAVGGVLVTASGEPAGLALVVLGALGVVFGLALLFAHYSLVIDRHAVTRRWSVLVPVRTQRTPVAGFDRVALVRRLGRTRYSYYTSASVCLVGPRGELPLRSGVDEDGLVVAAQHVSAFLGLPLADARQPMEVLVADQRARMRPLWPALVLGTVAFVVVLGIAAAVAVFALQGGAPSRERWGPRRHRAYPSAPGMLESGAPSK